MSVIIIIIIASKKIPAADRLHCRKTATYKIITHKAVTREDVSKRLSSSQYYRPVTYQRRTEHTESLCVSTASLA